MAPSVPASFGKSTAPKPQCNGRSTHAVVLIQQGLDRRSKSGLYFLSWFVSKEEFFTNP